MSLLTKDQRQEVLEHLKAGDKVLAVKAYREYVDSDLITAKKAVEALAAIENELTKDQRQAVIEHLKTGNKILAIKEYREYVKCDLKTAKDTVEALAESEGIELPAATGCGSAAALFLAGIATLFWGVQKLI